MSEMKVSLPVGSARAFELLEDPRSIRALVAGARRIRRFDPRWPEPGSVLHHSVGLQPVVLRGVTEVTVCEPGRRLCLEARVRLLGCLSIEFEFEPGSAGSTLTVREHVIGGPISLPGVRVLVESAIRLRNLELGRRFVRLAAERKKVAAGAALQAPMRHA